MINTETTTEKIARLLSAITEHDTKIDCNFSVDEYGKFISNNIIEQTGVVGQQMYSSIVLKYDICDYGRYLVFNPEFEYELLNGGRNGYNTRKDYIFDTEKDTFIFGEDKKQAENEIMAKFK
jgi:hypothetical protein